MLVVGLRLVVPLFIPRFPLPAILAALVIDGVDKSIFAAFTGLPLDNYQSYDKALDIYYLTIAYLSVLRNWRNPFAVGVAAFLWYYRLVGVLAVRADRRALAAHGVPEHVRVLRDRDRGGPDAVGRRAA